MAEANVTTDHDRIRKWAEDRGGRPTSVKGTAPEHEPGLLRFDFGEPEDRLEEIDWDEFFDKFEESNLAFLYQDKTSDGNVSRFHKFIARDDNH